MTKTETILTTFVAFCAVFFLVVRVTMGIFSIHPLQPSEMLKCGEYSSQMRAKWGLPLDAVEGCFVALADVTAAAYRSHRRDLIVEGNIKRWDKTTADDAKFWQKVRASGKIPVYGADGLKIPGMEAYFIRILKGEDLIKVIFYKP